MSMKQMNLAWVVVSDLNKAKKFFTESLGLKLCEHDTNHGWMELSGQEEGGAILGVAQTNPMDPLGPGQNAVVTISVDDVVKMKSQLEKKGVKMLGDIFEVPGHVKMQMIEDLDGNKFQIVQQLSPK